MLLLPELDILLSKLVHHFQVVRYPPKPTEEEGNPGVGMFGVGPHSDTGFLSLLLQDDVGGLQVRSLDSLPRSGPGSSNAQNWIHSHKRVILP